MSLWCIWISSKIEYMCSCLFDGRGRGEGYFVVSTYRKMSRISFYGCNVKGKVVKI